MTLPTSHPSPRLCDTFAGKHLVLTGATGFVAGTWLSMFLRHMPCIGRITLLTRGQGALTARERIAQRIDTSPVFRPLRAQHGSHLAAWLGDHIDILEADITQPKLGLTDDEYTSLAATADAIVHVAGLTDFHPDPARGVPANLDGTMYMADLAQSLRHPRMLHVSTGFVAGLRNGRIPDSLQRDHSPYGNAFDPVDAYQRLRQIAAEPSSPAQRTDAAAAIAKQLGWPNNYTLTKGLAEHLLAHRDLDLCIVRPTVVECARTYPFAGWNEGLNTSAPLMAYCDSPFTALPACGDHTFDIVPVDAVARAMTLALARLFHQTHHPVYQVATGDINPATFARIAELTALGNRDQLRHNPDATWRDRLIASLDISTRDTQNLPWLMPQTLGRLASRTATLCGLIASHDGLPAPMAQTLEHWQQQAKSTHRHLKRLHRMLEAYAPFIHDNHWIFESANLQQANAELHPDDMDAWFDDLATLCWRKYWLDIQVPGARQWSHPILRGALPPQDMPSTPPLSLHPQAAADAHIRESA